MNFHQALASFYRPLITGKDKIIMITPEFNSDVFAVQSWLELYQKNDCLIKVPVENTAEANDNIIEELERSKDVASVLCMSAVSYVTGQFYDIKRIAECCRRNKIVLILQLAHAMGAVELKLHEWEVDCAVWCSYKYLNCCQGTVGGIFVHENNFEAFPGLRGWFGVDKSVMFDIIPFYKKKVGAPAYQLSCVDPFQAARISSSLDTIEKFGGIKAIMEKNGDLYDYVYERLTDLKIEILSPKERGQHGGHISVVFNKSLKAKIMKLMDDRFLIVDFRDLNDSKFTVRAGLIAMYTDKADADAFVDTFKELLA